MARGGGDHRFEVAADLFAVGQRVQRPGDLHPADERPVPPAFAFGLGLEEGVLGGVLPRRVAGPLLAALNADLLALDRDHAPFPDPLPLEPHPGAEAAAQSRREVVLVGHHHAELALLDRHRQGGAPLGAEHRADHSRGAGLVTRGRRGGQPGRPLLRRHAGAAGPLALAVVVEGKALVRARPGLLVGGKSFEHRLGGVDLLGLEVGERVAVEVAQEESGEHVGRSGGEQGHHRDRQDADQEVGEGEPPAHLPEERLVGPGPQPGQEGQQGDDQERLGQEAQDRHLRLGDRDGREHERGGDGGAQDGGAGHGGGGRTSLARGFSHAPRPMEPRSNIRITTLPE